MAKISIDYNDEEICQEDVLKIYNAYNNDDNTSGNRYVAQYYSVQGKTYKVVTVGDDSYDDPKYVEVSLWEPLITKID